MRAFVVTLLCVFTAVCFAQGGVFLALQSTPPAAGLYGDCANDINDQLDTRYFNSCESGCGANSTALNADYLLCDDFEDGGWYDTTADRAAAANDGWSGNIQHGTDADDWTVCTNAGAGGTDCAATSGTPGEYPDSPLNSIHGAAARHWLYPDGVEDYQEVYIRYYIKRGSGTQGWEKLMYIEGFELSPGYQAALLMAPSETCPKADAIFHTGNWQDQNLGNELCMTDGKWYYIEMRFQLGTAQATQSGADGIFEIWMDDCGTDGNQCTGTETKRGSHSDVWFRNNEANGIHNIYLHNWTNTDAPTSKVQYYDQLVISKSFIGHCTDCPLT